MDTTVSGKIEVFTKNVEYDDPNESKNPESTKKRRNRVRTKAIRLHLKDRLETAILSPDSAIKDLLRARLNDSTLRASLWLVLSRLGLSENEGVKKLNAFAFKSISNITRVFKIVELTSPSTCKDESDTNSALRSLWICVEPRIFEHSDEKTVYVDNLPLQCSETKLRRRAAVFGTVAKIYLPQISRIQNQIGYKLNSGFGFIQFVSKTAAKRFCKRYAANSRLKRNKHGPHKRKVNLHENHNLNDTVDDSAKMEDKEIPEKEEFDSTGMSESLDFSAFLEFDNDSRRAMEEEIEREKPASTSIQSSAADVPFSQPAVPILKNSSTETKNVVPIKRANVESLEIGGAESIEQPAAKRRRIFAEDALKPLKNEDTVGRTSNLSLSICDSGNDTETESLLTKPKAQVTDADANKDGSKKRRRRRHKRKKSSATSGVSLTRMLRRIQVFSLKQYRELRAEYLKLKKERLIALKQQISGTNEAELKSESSKKTNEVIKIQKEGADSVKARKLKGKRKRKSRCKIFGKAERIRERNFLCV